MKFSLFIFLLLFLSCVSNNSSTDQKNKKKDNNIQMKVIGEPNINMKK